MENYVKIISSGFFAHTMGLLHTASRRRIEQLKPLCKSTAVLASVLPERDCSALFKTVLASILFPCAKRFF